MATASELRTIAAVLEPIRDELQDRAVEILTMPTDFVDSTGPGAPAAAGRILSALTDIIRIATDLRSLTPGYDPHLGWQRIPEVTGS